jgi:uncharacterized protein (TIGR02271 family)
VLAADTAPSSLAGLEVVDRRGERIGRVRQVYRDGAELGWVGVRGNLFGTEEVLVPLDGAVLEDDVIGVPVSRARFQSAPRRRPDAALEDDEREDLRSFWSAPVVDLPAAPVREAPTTDGPEEAGVMTASEERLRVDTERVPRTRVRLRKVVVTEQRTVTVPVRREEYRLIREPVVDGEPVAGGVIGPDEQEVVLYEERVVVTTEVVPIERIRLVKEEVVEHREVSGEVRRERIDLEDDGAAVEVVATEAEVVDPDPDGDPEEPIEAEIVPGPADEPEPPQATTRAIATKRSTSSRSPRRPGSTPARSRTSAADEAPPSTGASD